MFESDSIRVPLGTDKRPIALGKCETAAHCEMSARIMLGTLMGAPKKGRDE